jgi:polar amino acid transport system substrate-binding protein
MSTARLHGFAAIIVLTVVGCAARPAVAPPPAVPTVDSDVREALAPTGKLRVGLVLGGPSSAIRDPATGETKGVAWELGRELARRSGVPFEPVTFPSIATLVDGVGSGKCDVALLGVTSAREKVLDFTNMVLEVEFGYLVAAGAKPSNAGEVEAGSDAVAVPEKSAVDTILSAKLDSTRLVRAPSLPAGVEMLASGRVTALAGNKAVLFQLAEQSPGLTVLPGAFGTERQAMAMPKGREPGMRHLRKFIEDAKAEGLVQAAAGRANLRGLAAPR